MMNHSRRQILTPGPSQNKRKERDGLDGFKPSAITTKSLAKPSIHRAPAPLTNKSPSAAAAAAAAVSPKQQPACNNQLLAGYLANEFLTKGTLFGEPWDPARAEAVSVSSSAPNRGGGGPGKAYDTSTSGINKKEKRKAEPAPGPSEKDEKRVEKQQRYLEVADLLKGDGAGAQAHLPGIVNPTQLARFLHLG